MSCINCQTDGRVCQFNISIKTLNYQNATTYFFVGLFFRSRSWRTRVRRPPDGSEISPVDPQSDNWLVLLSGGSEAADRLAQKHQMVNVGEIIPGTGYFLLRTKVLPSDCLLISRYNQHISGKHSEETKPGGLEGSLQDRHRGWLVGVSGSQGPRQKKPHKNNWRRRQRFLQCSVW